MCLALSLGTSPLKAQIEQNAALTPFAERKATMAANKELSGVRWPNLREVQWAEDSFWGERQAVCRERMLPAMTRLMEGNETSHFLENFRIAAGWKVGKHRGADWNDGDTYKWLEAMAAAFASDPKPEVERAMQAAISAIAAAQRSDGYLHTPVLIAAINDPKSSAPLTNPGSFEMYNFGHLMTAACVHHEATGERGLLDVALRAADYLNEQFANPNRELARHAICPAHYMGLVDLYRTTHDEKWLRLAVQLLNMRDMIEGGGDDNQDRIPFREQREAVGHAVRANYLFAGATDLMLESRDRSLWPALEACWSSVHSKKIYITGGCGALFDGASPDGSKKQTSITRIHQAYGRNYQLPNSTAHNETCAAIGNVLWNQRMWQAEQEARYFDALETSLMNAVLAGVSLDGERFFYTNTLRQLDSMPVELRWSRERKAWISCYCCPPNVARTIATTHRLAYAYDDRSVWVLLYGTNRMQVPMQDGSLTIEQQSNYPADGRVKLTLQAIPNPKMELCLRIPGWCEQATITRNGQKETIATKSSSFARLTGPWKVGDQIELELQMPARLMSAHPLVEECRGQVAVQRGPLVYCLESKDLAEGVRLMDVGIDHDSQLIPRAGGLLPLVPNIEARLNAPVTYRASNELYKRHENEQRRSFTASLIPYFAWGNRGPSEMSVWIPLR